MTLRLIPVSSITTHWELNRQKDEHHVHALARHLNEDGYNQQFPLQVVVIGEERHLAAGHHRLAAASLSDITYPNLPLPEVWAEEKDGTMDDVIRIMQEDNLRHDPAVNASVGLPLTRQQKVEQCKTLLMFPDIFRESDRTLGRRFGVAFRTITNWRKETSVQIAQIADADMSDADLLVNFSMTRERLKEMVSLIQSGEREVTRGGTTYTQKTVASETKKATERETVTEVYEKTHASVKSAIADLVRDTTLMHHTVRRRLFDAFKLTQTFPAARRPVEHVKQETHHLSKLLKELQDSAGKWNEEFRRLHVIRTHQDTLIGMGAPFRVESIKAVMQNIARLPTADWEQDAQENRLQSLRRLCEVLPGLVKAERAARQDEQQRRQLELARQGASAACERLVETFKVSAVEDKSLQGYREFIVAACNLGGYSSTALMPDMFLKPEELKTESDGHRIRSIADKIRVQLSSVNVPNWMVAFLPDEELPSRHPRFQPSTEPAPAPEPEPEPEPEPAPVSQPRPKPAPTRLAAAMGYDMNLVGKKMRDAANAIGADLPADVRCPAWTVNLIQEHLKKRVPDRIEQADALRAVLLRLAKELINDES